jgi:DNA-binding NarL/FixJ family response regulator
VDVLIVDDHPIIHQTLGIAVDAVLPEARQHVAFNLTEALAIAGGLPLDSLVLLDLGLPEGSGMDVLKRFLSAFPQMTVVVVSATESSVLVAAAPGAYLTVVAGDPRLVRDPRRLHGQQERL